VLVVQEVAVQALGLRGSAVAPARDGGLTVAEGAHRSANGEPFGQGSPMRAGGVLRWARAVPQRALQVWPHAWQQNRWMRLVRP
jgi:hypothetical protein